MRPSVLSPERWDSISKACEAGIGRAMPYLTEQRHFYRANVHSLRFGVVPANVPDPRLVSVAGYLSIPYLTYAGVTSMRFRRPPGVPTGPRYFSLPGEPIRLYQPGGCLATMQNIDAVVICEGELDAAMAWQLGRGEWAAVGVPGAQAWQPHWRAALDGWPRVVVVPDADEAGRQLAARVRGEWPQAVTVEVETDLSDAAVAAPAELRARIAAALGTL